MADREEFSFEVEEQSSPGAGSDVDWMEETDSEIPENAGNGRKGSRTRTLLLLLLLAAVGGGAYFYFYLPGAEDSQSAPPVQVAAVKQPIAVPPRPVQKTPPVEKEAPAAEAKEMPSAGGEPVVPEIEKEVPQAGASDVPVMEEKKALPEKMAEEAPAVAEVKLGTTVRADEAPAEDAEGKYSIAAGAFLLRSNLAAAERRVQESGFEPQVVREKKMLDMTRLKVGIFPRQEVGRKMEELSGLAPDAFCLPAEGGMAIYAASFQNLDKARNFADRLYKQGLRVEEESARVEIPLYLLSFGGFADVDSARKAAGQVRAAGLDAVVIKNP